MAQPAKGQEPSMEDILASIRRIISDEPARLPAAEPRLLRNDQRSAEERGDDFQRDDKLRDELRARLLRPDGGTKPHEQPVEENPFQGGPIKAAQVQPAPQAPALTLDGIPSALEAELQHTDIDAMLAKLHAGAHRLQAEEPAPDMREENPVASIGFQSYPEAEKHSEQIYEDFAAELVSEAEPSEHVQEEEVTKPVSHLADSRQPQRAVYSALEPRPSRQQTRALGGPALLSEATSAAVDSAFNTLAETVLVQNGRTLEDLVREMLRPMLKSWLDDNLPNLVERLVRAEIERVSRGR